MKINLGCGFNKLNDFVNCDSNKRCKPDKVVDFSKGKLPFKDSEVDEVFANCFFEKLGDNFYDIMKEIYRVCKSGAFVDINFIHPRNDLFYSNPEFVRPLSIDIFRHFSKKYAQWYEETQKKGLSVALDLDVDFEIVDFRFGIESEYEQTLKENNPGQMEALSRRFANVQNEINVKLVVIK